MMRYFTPKIPINYSYWSIKQNYFIISFLTSNLRSGDRVRVIKKSKFGEYGWKNHWISDMSKIMDLNLVGVISEEFNHFNNFNKYNVDDKLTQLLYGIPVLFKKKNCFSSTKEYYECLPFNIFGEKTLYFPPWCLIKTHSAF